MKVLILLCIAVTAVIGTDNGGERAHNMRDLLVKVTHKYHGSDGVHRLRRRSASEANAQIKSFTAFVQMVDEVNADPDRTYSAEYNKISIMSETERAALGGLNMSTTLNRLERSADMKLEKRGDEPARFDWVKKGAVNAVKHQGTCGSCWAFSGVAALESAYYTLTGEKKLFSEQEALECVYESRQIAVAKLGITADNCKGGMASDVWKYVSDNDRLAEMKDFAYIGVDGKCSVNDETANSFTKAKMVANNGYSTTKYMGSDSDLQTAVLKGVVSVGINVISSGDPLYSYRTGVFVCRGNWCKNPTVNHAVNLVGYGISAAGTKYWNLRNSWGADWGEGGYFKISRAEENTLNVQMLIQLPNLECREGQTCTSPELTEEEWDAEEGELEKGNKVKCGQIVHSGGLCLSIDDTEDKALDLSAVCERTWCLTDKGYLYETATDMCANTDGGNGGAIKLRERCVTKWDKSGVGLGEWRSREHGGLCMISETGRNANAVESTKVVLHSYCTGSWSKFEFKDQTCWEVEDLRQFNSAIETEETCEDAFGSAKCEKLKSHCPSSSTIKTRCQLTCGVCEKGTVLKKFSSEEEAKETCMEDGEDCKGINFENVQMEDNLFTLVKDDDSSASKGGNKKIFKKVDCEEACIKGQMRCEDGDCKYQCETDVCPGGLTRCADGVCRHEEMCT